MIPPGRRTPRSPRSDAEPAADRAAPPPSAAGDERGGGVLAAWFGLLVFFALLLFAVQVLYNLYAASVVTSVSYDAARRVAAAGGGPGARRSAEADARQTLGRYSERVQFTWIGDGDVVVLRVEAHNPNFLLPAVTGRLTFSDLDRTVRVRVERFR